MARPSSPPDRVSSTREYWLRAAFPAEENRAFLPISPAAVQQRSQTAPRGCADAPALRSTSARSASNAASCARRAGSRAACLATLLSCVLSRAHKAGTAALRPAPQLPNVCAAMLASRPRISSASERPSDCAHLLQALQGLLQARAYANRAIAQSLPALQIALQSVAALCRHHSRQAHKAIKVGLGTAIRIRGAALLRRANRPRQRRDESATAAWPAGSVIHGNVHMAAAQTVAQLLADAGSNISNPSGKRRRKSRKR